MDELAENDPRLILTNNDTVMQRSISPESDAAFEYHKWSLSPPIPCMRIIGTWEVYYGISLVLSFSASSTYQIYQMTNAINPVLVHEHATEIYNIFYIDHGHAIFSATDGCWMTVDAGTTWQKLNVVSPAFRSALTLFASELIEGEVHTSRILLAYADDQKFYKCDLDAETLSFVEKFDSADFWSGKWYPALDGAPVAILAGQGNMLVRSEDCAESWRVIHTVDGIIKNIVASGKSNSPTFLIEVEVAGGQSSRFYWTYDLGDSLVPDLARFAPDAKVQSVISTGESEYSTMFAVLGKRGSESSPECKILGGGGT